MQPENTSFLLLPWRDEERGVASIVLFDPGLLQYLIVLSRPWSSFSVAPSPQMPVADVCYVLQNMVNGAMFPSLHVNNLVNSELGSLSLEIAEHWLYWGVYDYTLLWPNAASLKVYSSWSIHISTLVPSERHRIQERSGSQASNSQSTRQSEPPGSFQPCHLSHLFLLLFGSNGQAFWRFYLLKEMNLLTEMIPVESSLRH